ncbi:MAG: hypothetical protein K0S08_1701 [Gammaproteobacteria bacterium]|jgi:serine/threonine protein kinase|nr:hypothetical protein [Gammaproteobacteria bacterium]
MLEPLQIKPFPPKPIYVFYSAKDNELLFFYREPANQRKAGRPLLPTKPLKLQAAKQLSEGHSNVRLFENKNYQAVVKIINKSSDAASREFNLYRQTTGHQAYLLEQGTEGFVMVTPVIDGTTLYTAMWQDCAAFCQNLLLTLLIVFKNLKSLHEDHKISHGDLKETNILLGLIDKPLPAISNQDNLEDHFGAAFIDFEFSTLMGTPVLPIAKSVVHLPTELVDAPKTLLASPAIDIYAAGSLLQRCLNAANTTVERTIFYQWYQASQIFNVSKSSSLDILLALLTEAYQSAKMAKAKEIHGLLNTVSQKISQQLHDYELFKEFMDQPKKNFEIHCLIAQEILKIATQRIYETVISKEESFSSIEALLADAIEQLCVDEAFGAVQDDKVYDFLESCSPQQLFQITCDMILANGTFNHDMLEKLVISRNAMPQTSLTCSDKQPPIHLSRLSLSPIFQSTQQLEPASAAAHCFEDPQLLGPGYSKQVVFLGNSNKPC